MQKKNSQKVKIVLLIMCLKKDMLHILQNFADEYISYGNIQRILYGKFYTFTLKIFRIRYPLSIQNMLLQY